MGGEHFGTGYDRRVKANVPPTVAMTAPATGVTAYVPGTVTLAANAGDSDGWVAKVEFFSGGTLIGADTTAPFSYSWTNAAVGSHSLTAKATDSKGAATTSAAIAMEVKSAPVPVVSITSPQADARFVAPAGFAVTASASVAGDTISKVEYISAGTLIGTATAAPYTINLSNVVAGNYNVSAKAYGKLGGSATSPVVNLVVANAAPTDAAQVYYIHSDQINTAREITNSAGAKVWEGDPDPFGANLPNENPAGQGTFTYNPRFPGQYFDKESGLHYNYFRDYDPQTGRYVQSDPIGLDGGINTYGYVGGNPISRVDPTGELFFVPVAYWAGASLVAATGGTIWWQQMQAADRQRDEGRAVYEALMADARAASAGDVADARSRIRSGTGWPNGPEENEKCRRLREKIEKIRNEVWDKRIPDLASNGSRANPLPYRIAPGEALRDTVRGHEKLLNRQWRRLNELEEQYRRECEGRCR
jgi:RHS repeat-associated protein